MIVLPHTYVFLASQDQFDSVSSHTLKGVEFLEKYGRFQKDRCDVENRYAADLR